MIVVDIGNTTLHFAWIRNQRIFKELRIPNDSGILPKIKKIFSDRPKEKEKVLICSVVPEATAIFKKAKKDIYLIGKDLKVPLKCFYNKRKVGMDRLVGAYAAKALFPGTRMILDFGTAITLDFLSFEKIAISISLSGRDLFFATEPYTITIPGIFSKSFSISL